MKLHKLYAENILIGSSWKTDLTLTIEDGFISQLEEGRSEGADVLDGPVIPGMVNCHSHAFQRAFAGFSEYRGNTQDSFWSWRDIMYRLVAKVSPEDAHVIAEFVYIEMLKAGYTSVAEFHYLHHQTGGERYQDPAEMSHQIIQAAKNSGISMTHLPVLYTYSGFGGKPASQSQARFTHATDDYLTLIEILNKQYSGDKNFKLGIAPHSLRAVNEQQLKEVVPFIRKLSKDSPIHIHISEQLQEVNDCVKFNQARPVEWLLEHFDVDRHWCLIHATHLSKNEVTDIVRSGAVVGICPTTEANLGDGIFPTSEFCLLGGEFAIGSDSHIGINVAEELRLLEYAQRLTKNQRAILADEECTSVGQFLYTKASQGGAIAIGQKVGQLDVGRRADLLVLNQNKPSLFCKKDSFILDASIFACNQLPVKDVYVAGKRKVEDGVHPNEESVVKRYAKVLKNLI